MDRGEVGSMNGRAATTGSAEEIPIKFEDLGAEKSASGSIGECEAGIYVGLRAEETENGGT